MLDIDRSLTDFRKHHLPVHRSPKNCEKEKREAIVSHKLKRSVNWFIFLIFSSVSEKLVKKGVDIISTFPFYLVKCHETDERNRNSVSHGEILG